MKGLRAKKKKDFRFTHTHKHKTNGGQTSCESGLYSSTRWHGLELTWQDWSPRETGLEKTHRLFKFEKKNDFKLIGSNGGFGLSNNWNRNKPPTFQIEKPDFENIFWQFQFCFVPRTFQYAPKKLRCDVTRETIWCKHDLWNCGLASFTRQCGTSEASFLHFRLVFS